MENLIKRANILIDTVSCEKDLNNDDKLLEIKLIKKNSNSILKLFKSNQNETIQYTEDPIVSSDIIGRKCGSLVDGLSTNVLEVDGKQLVKVIAWYDNEMSYTAQMVRTAKYLMK